MNERELDIHTTPTIASAAIGTDREAGLSEGDKPEPSANPATSATAEEVTEYLWTKRHDALYRAELSTLYHRRRERFFDTSDKIAKAVAVLGGAASLSTLIGADSIKWAAAMITVTSTISLVFGLSERARRHAELASSFKRLESKILSSGERDFTEADVNCWLSEVRSLEATEPAALSALVTDCQNRMARAVGQIDAVRELSLFRRLTMHIA